MTDKPQPVTSFAIPPRPVYVTEGRAWYVDPSNVVPVDLVGVVIYADGSSAPVIVDAGHTQVLRDWMTCEHERDIDWAS